MGPLYATLLALLQGVTEFLPVSSSGHLALAQIFLPDLEPDIAFDVLLHVGTVFAILVYFHREIRGLVVGLLRPGPSREEDPFSGAERRTVAMILVATVVTGVLGLSLEPLAEAAFHRAEAVGLALLVTAALLALCLRVPSSGEGIAAFPWWKAVLVGAAQGLAVFPGISRSGATIAVCLLLGLDRRTAAPFSLLLSVPAILGAFALKASDLAGTEAGVATMAWALVLTAAVGIVCIHLLVGSVRRGWFHRFAWYCAVLGLVVLGVAALR